ncbi:hypothetical protein HSBAA_38360 [Vreelandella sulfidaeris]|uniref:Uncharacterized protein n=1 Tax=Vreelandella sulfidaeris TaxID=115553 RepID=A0A455U8M1_9GAMM|nr:hypothetical protein HSBAA_38360 [Halomonas sulfidaeris]
MEHASSLGLSLIEVSDLDEEGREALRLSVNTSLNFSIHSSFAIYIAIHVPILIITI